MHAVTATSCTAGTREENDAVIARRIKHDLSYLAQKHRNSALGEIIRPVCGLASVIERGLNSERRAA